MHRPTVISLVVCEQAIVEEGTRNFTLVNCFSRLRVRQIPSEPQRFTVYVLLTDGKVVEGAATVMGSGERVNIAGGLPISTAIACSYIAR